MYITESQLDAYLAKRCQEIKDEAEVEVECTVTGDLEYYTRAQRGTSYQISNYGFDSDEEQEEYYDRIANIVRKCRVRLEPYLRGTVFISGKCKNVKKAIAEFERNGSIVDVGEFKFDKYSIEDF